VLIAFLADRRFPAGMANFEENVLSVLLAIITFVAFTQVIARYVFNSGWSGALEFQRILFAWMILLGMSYGVRSGAHLGVDAFIRMFPKPLFKAVAIFGAISCILYAAILLGSSWMQYFGAHSRGGAMLYWTTIFRSGSGLDEMKYPQFIVDMFQTKERIHRWVAYLVLPGGLALFAFRSLQALFEIVSGKRELMIASHEAEELVAEHKDVLKD
jgi:C4-dicarboxylate transporter DctQ subunit